MPACGVCQKILDTGPHENELTGMHNSWDSLIQSIEKGCPICFYVWQKIRPDPSTHYRDVQVNRFECRWHEWRQRSEAIESAPADIRFDLWISQLPESYKTVEVHLVDLGLCGTSASSPSQTLPNLRKLRGHDATAHVVLDQNALSNPTIDSIVSWLEHCQKHHKHCRYTPSSPKGSNNLPARFLDLHGQRSKTWSLVVAGDNHPVRHSNYIALSHRWADGMPKLLKTNIDRYQSSQRDDVLPQGYQDIFALCRRLSVQYVWIDSLCILQDSNADFQKEASSMTEVYSGAYCTLSLSWNSESLFFNGRNPCTTNPTVEHHRHGDKREAIVLAHGQHYKEVAKAPLFERGWVFQETMLSPRIIHTGREQLYWICRQDSRCEAYPDGFPTKLEWELGTLSSSMRRDFTKTSSRDLRQLWDLVVKQYSRTSLTYETDRLVALSGLARLWASLRPDDYIAGLWKKRILSNLCWIDDNDGAPQSKGGGPVLNSSYIAPSWSWASGSYVISYPAWISGKRDEIPHLYSFTEPQMKPLAYFQSYDVTPRGPDPFGQIDCAYITLVCYMTRLESVEFAGHNSQWWATGVSLEEPKKTQSFHGRVNLTLTHYDQSLPCFLVPLLLGVTGSAIYGLVIQQAVQGHGKGHGKQYKRIGHFEDRAFGRAYANTMELAAQQLPGRGDPPQIGEYQVFEQNFKRCFSSWNFKEDSHFQRLKAAKGEWAFEGEWETVTLI
ncbi:heterokaryon incompatibility protein-domain-containing protein [Hypoxylon sp. NC1633]|nr:heterokaryon incompatibility protein-domain-containing protein [Hypoxylon sp. NC1633]